MTSCSSYKDLFAFSQGTLPQTLCILEKKKFFFWPEWFLYSGTMRHYNIWVVGGMPFVKWRRENYGHRVWVRDSRLDCQVRLEQVSFRKVCKWKLRIWKFGGKREIIMEASRGQCCQGTHSTIFFEICSGTRSTNLNETWLKFAPLGCSQSADITMVLLNGL